MLSRYFEKVIDLRETERKLKLQCSEMEASFAFLSYIAVQFGVTICSFVFMCVYLCVCVCVCVCVCECVCLQIGFLEPLGAVHVIHSSLSRGNG